MRGLIESPFIESLERRALFSAGLVGQYFDNIDFTNLKLTRTDSQINFDWGAGSPDKSIGPDTFSVRWNGYIEPAHTERYTFTTSNDDGVRLWVNGEEIINEFKDQTATLHGSINLTAGTFYAIRIDYYEDLGNAKMKLSWSSNSTPQKIVPSSALFTTLPTSSTTIPPAPKSPPPPPAPPTPPPTTSISYSGPIKITKGGTYTGNWESDDPNTPAVVIETTAPVTIINSNILSKGESIATWVNHTNVTIENTSATALNPDVAGRSPGRFLDDEFFNNIVVQNCSMTGTSGILLDTYVGDGTTDNTIKILNNTATNIDGRHSDGDGGFVTYNTRTNLSTGQTQNGYDVVQFLQIAKSQDVPGVVVSGNHVVNQPGKSRVEDNISIFLSSGTASSPILVHDNTIDGAYNVDPTQSNYSDGTYSYDFSYSGGGIMLGDGTPDSTFGPCAFVNAYDNTIIDTTNYGIAITSGHDLQFYNNTIFSTGKLSDGSTVIDQNVGAAVWNANGQSSSIFYNDGGYDNQINWLDHGVRNDWWVPSASDWTDNVHSSTQPAGD